MGSQDDLATGPVRLACTGGDGIGPEVVVAAVRVVNAVCGDRIEWVEAEMGRTFERTGSALPEATVQILEAVPAPCPAPFRHRVTPWMGTAAQSSNCGEAWASMRTCGPSGAAASTPSSYARTRKGPTPDANTENRKARSRSRSGSSAAGRRSGSSASPANWRSRGRLGALARPGSPSSTRRTPPPERRPVSRDGARRRGRLPGGRSRGAARRLDGLSPDPGARALRRARGPSPSTGRMALEPPTAAAPRPRARQSPTCWLGSDAGSDAGERHSPTSRCRTRGLVSEPTR